MPRGLFLTLEGPEGAGKSTQGPLLAEHLRRSGLDVLSTREPGGTPIGERIRGVLLDEAHREMAAETEMLLFAAARAQFVREVVSPALARGVTVLSDRYVDASLAYQGFGRGLDVAVVRWVNEVATGGLLPDLTVLLDIEPTAGLARARAARGKEGAVGRGDRLEQEAAAFYGRVRAGFLQLARESPQRFAVIDARGDVDEVRRRVIEAVDRFLRESRERPEPAG
ncbi:MAG: dTMP kinase [Armatimonadetes bacterium]|nr:dTMP kinase [Armatimonadota bacterium]